MTTPEMIAEVEFMRLPLAGEGCIVADPTIQQRVALDHAKVDEYAELYRERRDLSPLTVFQTDEGLLLVDGFHRRLAALAAGLSTLPCMVLPGTRRDAILRATSQTWPKHPLHQCGNNRLYSAARWGTSTRSAQVRRATIAARERVGASSAP
jgi:ParB-like chromosome segregation protein Spo0J